MVGPRNPCLGAVVLGELVRKFQFRSVVASVGDFVLVLNADTIESDTVDGTDVAKILQLYDSDTDKEDPYRAVVQWYSRVRELPKKVVSQFDCNPPLCHEQEVVEDTRQFDNDISIETVFRKCRVVFIPPSKDPKEEAREERSNSTPLFMCRFKLISRNRRNMTLEPVSANKQVESSNEKSKRSRQRKFLDDFVYGLTTSPGQKKSNTPKKTKDVRNNTSDSNDDEIIKCSPKNKQQDKQFPPSTSKKNSSEKNHNGVETVSDIHMASVSKSSDRKRKTSDKLSDLDSDSEIKPKHVSSHDLKNSLTKVVNGKKSSSKICRQEHLTPSGNTLRQSGGKRPTGVSKARRRLSIDLEGTAESQPKPNGTTPDSDSDNDEIIKQSTPKRKRDKTRSKGHTPSMPQRNCSVLSPSTVLEEARLRLHVSALPKDLPCRETEFQSVHHFVRTKVLDNMGGCMYISGVPGTGKTATVHEVLNYLQSEVDTNDLPEYKLVKINGMQLTNPRQAYVEILHQLTGQKMKSQQAQQILEKRFKTPAPRRTMTVLIVDELDLLCTRRQDVVYNLLDWPNYSTAHLVVITIANTMDLPERSFINRVNSRMGLTRITFQPYTYVQLQKIVMSRLDGVNAFDPDAVQLIARKVAAVSGDARRALDMCRRATEISSLSSEVVTMGHVTQVLQEMITSPKIQAIRSCSMLEQAFLRATAAEVARTGVEETIFSNVYHQLCTLCVFDNLTQPTISQAFGLCARLGACRLLLTEQSPASTYQRIILNVSTDDIHYATSQQSDVTV